MSGGSDKIHKVLEAFSVVDVSGTQVFQEVRSAEDVTIEDYMIGSSAPQMHLNVSSMPQRYRHVPKRATPALSQFSATHRLRGSSESDGRQTARVIRSWAGGVALSHDAHNVSRRLKPEFISCAWSASLKVECSLRRWASGMPESTGKSSLQVGFRHPVMMRNVSTCWSRRWFEQLSSSIGWRVIALQTFAKILAMAGLRG